MNRTHAALPFPALLLCAALAACDSDGGTGLDLPDAVGFDTPADPGGHDTGDPGGRDATDVPGTDEGTPEVPAGDVAGPEEALDPGTDAPPADLPPADVGPTDTPPADLAPPDASADEGAAPTVLGHLVVDCDVPGVLDASKAGDMLYMTTHFGDLVQQWGITGTVAGVDLTGYPEKMYYGTHPVDDAYLTLTQASMTAGLQPVYSVLIDFAPDSAVTSGSAWGVGLEDGQALATVVKHSGTSSLCVLAMGLGGTLTFSQASGVTQVEGGSFSVSGAFDVVDPHDVPGVCEALGAGGCCP